MAATYIEVLDGERQRLDRQPPTRFYVEHENPAHATDNRQDPFITTDQPTLSRARSFAKGLTGYWRIVERIELVGERYDITTRWTWREAVVQEA